MEKTFHLVCAVAHLYLADYTTITKLEDEIEQALLRHNAMFWDVSTTADELARLVVGMDVHAVNVYLRDMATDGVVEVGDEWLNDILFATLHRALKK